MRGRLTQTGTMVGTFSYMAPERFLTGTVDARADVYSLACVLHECLTGAAPFPGTSMEQQIAAHLTMDPPKPSTVSATIPAGFDDVIARGMAKQPAERYQTAAELSAAAQNALNAAPTPSPPSPQVDHRHPPPPPQDDDRRPPPPSPKFEHRRPPPQVDHRRPPPTYHQPTMPARPADLAMPAIQQPPVPQPMPLVGSAPAAPAAAAEPAVDGLPRSAYTPWFRRVLAFIIDYIPCLTYMSIGGVILDVTRATECYNYGYGYSDYCSLHGTAVGWVSFYSAVLVSSAYLIWNFGFRQGRTGSSIGKSMMKFKVVSEKTGRPIGFWSSVVRQIAHILDSAICNIGYLFPLWTPKRQTLADMIMKTVCLPLR